MRPHRELLTDVTGLTRSAEGGCKSSDSALKATSGSLDP